MGVGAYNGSTAPANSLIVSGYVGIGKSNPQYSLDLSGSASIDGNLVIQTGGSMANPLEVRGSAAIGSYAGNNEGPVNGLIVSGNVGIGRPDPEYLLDVAGDMRCNAFSTSSSLNFNFITNPPPARSTSSGWQGIRQVFGDHVTCNVYVYNNNSLETTLTGLPGSYFGAFVAIGGPLDDLIVVSGVGEFYYYFFDGETWQGPYTIPTNTYMDPDDAYGPSLWMPSIGATNTIIIGPYGYLTSPGSPNPSVGLFRFNDGDINFVTTITPDGDPERYTVAISGDENTVVIGAGFIGVLSIYNLRDTLTPSLRYTTPSDSYYNVSINYDGTLVLLTHGGLKQVLMFSLD
jgi:hypothetical protein